MSTILVADRRLYLTGDRSRVVEEGDAAAAYLFAPVGGQISAEDAGRYGLTAAEGAVVLPAPATEPAEDEKPRGKRKG